MGIGTREGLLTTRDHFRVFGSGIPLSHRHPTHLRTTDSDETRMNTPTSTNETPVDETGPKECTRDNEVILSSDGDQIDHRFPRRVLTVLGSLRNLSLFLPS